MACTFNRRYHVAAFVWRLLNSLDYNGVDVVHKVPELDYDASAQSRHLNNMLRRRRNFRAVIIAPGQVGRLREELKRFCRKVRMPVIFTDLEPFDRAEDYPENSVYVGYDTGRLGELAGEWIANKLPKKKRSYVLIIAGSEHTARQQRCKDTLYSELSAVDVEVDDACTFTRTSARDAVRGHIQRLAAGKRLDAIFCTSDEMALGAADALQASSPAAEATLVVGVDGIEEARELIKAGHSPLKATVVQDPHRLACVIADVLEKMLGGREVPKRTILSGEIYEAP